MKKLTKIKQAVKKELDGYSEAKKRKMIVLFMTAFALLILLNFYVAYLKLFQTNDNVSKQHMQTISGFEPSAEQEITHQQMMENLRQMKNDVLKQRKSYENTIKQN